MARQIREEKRFREQLEELRIDARHWDEVFYGLSFDIARRPELFERIQGGPLRVATIECYPGLPELSYTVRLQ